MSKENVKEIINKAKQDSSFLQNILKNPEKALHSYELTKAEMNFFKTADKKTIEGLKDSCFELV